MYTVFFKIRWEIFYDELWIEEVNSQYISDNKLFKDYHDYHKHDKAIQSRI